MNILSLQWFHLSVQRLAQVLNLAPKAAVLLFVLIEPLNDVERHKTFHRCSLFFQVLSRIVHAYANDFKSVRQSVFYAKSSVINRRLLQQILPVLKGTEGRFFSSMSFVLTYGKYHHNFLTILAQSGDDQFTKLTVFLLFKFYARC